MVISRKRMAESVHFVEAVVAGMEVVKDSGMTVKVAGIRCASVGINVAVTKYCVGIFCTPVVMDTQDVRKIKTRIVKRIFFAIYLLKHAMYKSWSGF